MKRPSAVRVDLGGLSAARFRCVLGGDFPVGDETQRRKTVAIRSKGTEARFLTVIEPFESERVVKRAEAVSADRLRVELIDGRIQEIEFTNLIGTGRDIGVRMTETKDGKELRAETSQSLPN